MMRLEVIVDGKLVQLPPRREEMIRQLLRADTDVDAMEVGALEFRLAQEKVSLRVTKSYPAVKILRWTEWLRNQIAPK